MKAKLYTKGKFATNTYRGTADTDNPYLYSKGRFKTKIQESDLPDTYIKCNPRTYCYMLTWVQTKGVKCIYSTVSFLNHWAKDDYLYISYDKPITFIPVPWYKYSTEEDNQYMYPSGYDLFVCGGEIDRLALAIAKNSPKVDGLVQFVQSRLEKIAFLQLKHPECLPQGDYFREIVKGYSDILASTIARPTKCCIYE